MKLLRPVTMSQLVSILFLVLIGKPAIADSVRTCVFSGGATNVSNANYRLQGTLRQTAIRLSAGSSILESGYWPFIWSKGPCCIGMRGNCDGDHLEAVDIGDVTRLSDYLFISFEPPSCMIEADCDGDGNVDITDLTDLNAYLFLGGQAPVSCP